MMSFPASGLFQDTHIFCQPALANGCSLGSREIPKGAAASKLCEARSASQNGARRLEVKLAQAKPAGFIRLGHLVSQSQC